MNALSPSDNDLTMCHLHACLLGVKSEIEIERSGCRLRRSESTQQGRSRSASFLPCKAISSPQLSFNSASTLSSNAGFVHSPWPGSCQVCANISKDGRSMCCSCRKLRCCSAKACYGNISAASASGGLYLQDRVPSLSRLTITITQLEGRISPLPL